MKYNLHLWTIHICNFSIFLFNYKNIQNLKLEFNSDNCVFFQFMVSWTLSINHTRLISVVLSSSNHLLTFFMHKLCKGYQSKKKIKTHQSRYLPRLGYKINATKALLCFCCINTTVAVICRAGGCKYG